MQGLGGGSYGHTGIFFRKKTGTGPVFDKFSHFCGVHPDKAAAFFDGDYFDGDTIFLYDGASIVTFLDAEAGIFFGQSISTATGCGTGQTLWSMFDIYDIEALDIGIINPEPSTLPLLAPGLLGFAGLLRRKFRSSVEPWCRPYGRPVWAVVEKYISCLSR